MLRNIPIRKKMMTVIMLICGVVLFLTCSVYFVYEFFTFRMEMQRQVVTTGEIIAANSTAALAFDSRKDADEILSALKAEHNVVAAALYDRQGNIFSVYPSSKPISEFPAKPGDEGYRFGENHLIGFHEVKQGDKKLGTLYLKSDMKALTERFVFSGYVSAIVIILSFSAAYLISIRIQRSISTPIVRLAETAKTVTRTKNYALRATWESEDELGFLTSAFNDMLARIQDQNSEIILFSQNLEKKVIERTTELQNNIQQLNQTQEQLKRTSELFLRLFDKNPASIVISRLDDAVVINVNEAFLSSFGFSDKEEVLGKTANELNIVAYPEQREELALLLQENKIVKDFEIKTFSRQGKVFWISTSILAIEIENIPCLFSISIDITNRKEIEEQMRTANKELEAFSYSVSHDLRAPLRSIHSYINILYEEYADQFDAEARRLINIVINNSKKMGQLIDDLLAFSKLGRKELVKTTVRMNALVKNILEDQIRVAPRNNLELILSDLPDASADSSTIAQVWTNLISNALKYSRNKGHAVVELGHLEREGKTVYYVRDNGAGFDMKYYDKLFGVFQRLHSSKEFDGTGVGLAIVQRIIAKHGGTVWAKSKVQEGTTFYFSINEKISINLKDDTPSPDG